MTAKRWIAWSVAVVSFGVIVWLALRDNQVISALRMISPLQIMALFVFQVLYLVVESRRLEIVIEDASGTKIPSLPMLSLFSVGRVLNLLVPQAGNVYRGVRLNRAYGIAASDYAGALGAFVWLTAVLSLVTSGVVLGLTQRSLTVSSLPLWSAMIGAGILLTVIPVALFAATSSMIHRGRPETVVGKITSVVVAAANAVTNPILILKFLATWLMTIAVVAPMYIWTFSIMDVSVGLGVVIALYGLVQVTSFVVITPGNIGIQDLGFTGLAILLGVPAGPAAAAAGLIRASGVIATVGTAMLTGWSDLVHATTGRDEHSGTDRGRST